MQPRPRSPRALAEAGPSLAESEGGGKIRGGIGISQRPCKEADRRCVLEAAARKRRSPPDHGVVVREKSGKPAVKRRAEILQAEDHFEFLTADPRALPIRGLGADRLRDEDDRCSEEEGFHGAPFRFTFPGYGGQCRKGRVDQQPPSAASGFETLPFFAYYE